MKKNYLGLDVLRGLGLFSVITLHTAFYYYDGIYDLDLNDPPLIITIIGFLLMFAGMFAMISGLVHTLQAYRKIKEKGFSYKNTFKYALFAGLYILLIAYLYFLVTAPGIIHFDTRSMDNSFLVELIKEGNILFPSIDRILYIDSLVMIGSNIILVSLATIVGFKLIKSDSKRSYYFYLLAVAVLLLSIVRIPLYSTYLDARDNGNYFVVLLLNWFVNKNNPILPFYAFGLFGAWVATLLIEGNVKKTRIQVLTSGIVILVIGVIIYVTAEETMLDRLIDYTWYGIMIMQIGLFKLIILLFLKLYKNKESYKETNILSRFLYRFGIAGLTVFFIEQVFSSLLKEIFRLIDGNLFLELYPSVVIGLVIAFIWGVLLKVWSKYNYKYGVEYFYTVLMNKYGGSEKRNKLEE